MYSCGILFSGGVIMHLNFESYTRYYNMIEIPEYVQSVLTPKKLNPLDIKLLNAVNQTHGFIQNVYKFKNKTTPLIPTNKSILKVHKVSLAKAINPFYRTVTKKGVNIRKGQYKAYNLTIPTKLVYRFFGNAREEKFPHIIAFLKFFIKNPERLKPLLYPEVSFTYNNTKISLLYAESMLWISKSILPIMGNVPQKYFINSPKDFIWDNPYLNYMKVMYLHKYFNYNSELYSVIADNAKKLGDFTFGNEVIKFTKYKNYLVVDIREKLAIKYKISPDDVDTSKINLLIIKLINNNLKKSMYNWNIEDYKSALETLMYFYDNNYADKIIEKYL